MPSHSTSPESTLEARRIAVFLAVAFGLAWATGAAIYATGGLTDSPQVLGPVSLATVLLVTTYMWAPALANVVARALSGEGFDRLALRPHIAEGWRYWPLAWFGPLALIAAGAALYFLAFPAQFDPSLSGARSLLEGAGVPAESAPLVLLVQVGVAVLLGPLLNAPATFGEEFGWRGYLLPKLLALGEHRAVLLSGVVWGVWHWPVIAMGYNYGTGYPGAPWSGMAAMVVATVGLGGAFSWLALRGGSVWPAVIAHGAVNASAGLALLFVAADASPHTLFGPAAVGVLGALPWLAVTAWAMTDRERLRPRSPERFP
jgi:membrane protease YdiL (CAAX protease family)